ncbi:MAG: DUF433 domain-containing protein [Actinomycetota bacterium]|nr:DUF433 domain-containing protein [Actinomycetota bacterium]
MTDQEQHPFAELRFGIPIYTVAEAARHLGVPESTFRAWSHGYVRQQPSRKPVKGNAFVTTIAARKGQPVVPFVGLVEGMVAAAFRRAGVSLQHIRTALRILEDEIGLEHALASRRLYTDGGRILFDYAKKTDDDELAVVVTGQRVFTDVVKDYLARIRYAQDDYASRLILPVTVRPLIEVDPKRNFGRPRFINSGAPVAAVLNRFKAGESLVSIAADFDLDSSDIEDVLRAALPDAA